MRASTLVLTCLAAAGVASAMWLGLQLSEERARSDALSAELASIRGLGAPPSAVTEIPPPTSSAPASPGAPGVAAPPKVTEQVELGPNSPPPGARRDFNEARRQLLDNPE